jgi:hypothetical protein
MSDNLGPIIQEIWRTQPGAGRIVGVCQFQDKVIIATEFAVYEMVYGFATGMPQVRRMASEP